VRRLQREAGVAPSGLTAGPASFSLNAVKKSSAIFLATPSINREPTWASLPPTLALAE